NRDPARCCDSRHWRCRFRLSCHQTPPARDPGRSCISRRKSREHIKIGRKRCDRFGPAVSHVRDQDSSGWPPAGTGSNATAAATTQASTSVSSRCEGTTTERKLTFMGHNKGRDNVKKRTARRKKAERLALAKQPSQDASTRQREKSAAK